MQTRLSKISIVINLFLYPWDRFDAVLHLHIFFRLGFRHNAATTQAYFSCFVPGGGLISILVRFPEGIRFWGVFIIRRASFQGHVACRRMGRSEINETHCCRAEVILNLDLRQRQLGIQSDCQFQCNFFPSSIILHTPTW